METQTCKSYTQIRKQTENNTLQTYIYSSDNSETIRAVIQEQLCNFLSENGVINSKQSGFRRSHSTATATIDVTDYILEIISEGNLVGAVFIDLAKAFDTADHKILSKLDHYGIRDIECNWFKSYLSDRYQVTLVNEI